MRVISFKCNYLSFAICFRFDCAIGDPEGEMEVSPWGIEYMVGLLAAQKVPLVCLLEGGYFIPSVGECAVHTMKALINKVRKYTVF